MTNEEKLKEELLAITEEKEWWRKNCKIREDESIFYKNERNVFKEQNISLKSEMREKVEDFEKCKNELDKVIKDLKRDILSESKRALFWEKRAYKSLEDANYYQEKLSEAHTILGRVIHQHSERWDSVNLTKYWPVGKRPEYKASEELL